MAGEPRRGGAGHAALDRVDCLLVPCELADGSGACPPAAAIHLTIEAGGVVGGHPPDEMSETSVPGLVLQVFGRSASDDVQRSIEQSRRSSARSWRE